MEPNDINSTEQMRVYDALIRSAERDAALLDQQISDGLNGLMCQLAVAVLYVVTGHVELLWLMLLVAIVAKWALLKWINATTK